MKHPHTYRDFAFNYTLGRSRRPFCVAMPTLFFIIAFNACGLFFATTNNTTEPRRNGKIQAKK